MRDSTSVNFDALWDYHDPARSERAFRDLLPQFEAGDDPSQLGQLLTQMARAQGLQRNFDGARTTLMRVERSLDQRDVPIVRVRYLLEFGRVLNSSGSPRDAKPYFQQAFELAHRQGLDFYSIDAAHMIAIVEPAPADQLRWNELALELAEKSADARARGWRGSLYNNIGWTYFEQKDYDRAMEVFEKAVNFRTEAGKARELRIARYCVAKTLRMQGKIDDALMINREIVAHADAEGESDGYFLEELAECLLAQGKRDEARPIFARAHEQLSKDKWLVESEPARVKRLQELSK